MGGGEPLITYYSRQTFFVILGHFLPFYTPNSAKNENLKKKWKKIAWRYHHFTHVYQKLLDNAQLLRYGARRTDGKSDIERWLHHLKNKISTATVLHLWGFTLLFSVNCSKFGRPQVVTDLELFPLSRASSYFQLYIVWTPLPSLWKIWWKKVVEVWCRGRAS